MDNSLFIIGNGFDSYKHGLKTNYSDFKDYLIRRFPDYDMNYNGLLEQINMPDGDVEYDMSKFIGCFIRILNDCTRPEWKNLEECLGNELIKEISVNNKVFYHEIKLDEDDNAIARSVYSNEDVMVNIVGAYEMIQDLFKDWVFHEFASIDYTCCQKIRTPSFFNNGKFLNFNYTLTLEKVYNISPNNICHIHGCVNDLNSDIYFGHGNNEEYKRFSNYWGIDEAYNELKQKLRKNTREALFNHFKFFNSLVDIERIYSYGFSFSDVDMIYIKTIRNEIKSDQVIWYFNNFDWNNNKVYIDKIKNLGFKVDLAHEW